MPLKRHKQSCSDRAAYTLIEIAVVVTIIGILAAMAVPYFKRIKESSIISTLENDLRIFSQEFMQYELNFGTYPDTQSTPGAFPSGMEGRISNAWTLPSVIGGTYRWVYNGGGNNNGNGNSYAYIEITGNSTEMLRIDPSRLSEIDDDIDDGNTGTGNLQMAGLSIRYYLEQ
jgi:prepilin-type N-terminal cleavage/methylation domain-containing protein